jgi:hypothetical protein
MKEWRQQYYSKLLQNSASEQFQYHPLLEGEVVFVFNELVFAPIVEAALVVT